MIGLCGECGGCFPGDGPNDQVCTCGTDFLPPARRPGPRRTPMPRGTKRLERRTRLTQGGQLARTRLNPASSKRDKANRDRRTMAAALFPDGPPQCAVPDCSRRADDLHEPLTRGRGGSITDPDNAEPLCRPHHDEVTFTEPDWAYDLGLLIHSWETTPPAELAAARRNLLHGLPAPITYCQPCTIWHPTAYTCTAASTTQNLESA
ncbi:hypothetical protein [Streptosporangium sp. NPDC048865]|uniref:hypothetical protein n=1 Tax=Streptosporangium sp. NPDC048865 TaxID=3155766 RepID=UPI003440ED2B